MIKLVAPTEGTDGYAAVEGCLVGPIFTGSTPSYENIVSFRTMADFLIDSPGIFHENNVENMQGKGVLVYDSCIHALQDFSAPASPYRLKLRYAASSYLDCMLGRLSSNSYRWWNDASFVYHRTNVIHSDGIGFTQYQARATLGSSKPSVAYVITHTYTGCTATTVQYARTSQAKNVTTMAANPIWGSPGGLTSEFLQSSIVARPNLGGTAIPVARSYSRVKPYGTGAILSPSAVRAAVDLMVIFMFGKIFFGFPIEDENYGDLAMRASSQVNANDVNMLEFLMELRHPTKLIPRLRKLADTKGLASEYLKLEYGILPTIDDIQSIINACSRVAPYLDKGGRETYSSTSRQSLSTFDYDYALEQHLKLAIGKEDSDLEALIERLDSMGTLPTFERVWDLVPYSFLVDWFVGVGDFLERADTRLRLKRQNIVYVTMSRKQTMSKTLVASLASPWSGTISLEYYHRWVSDQCPTPPLSLHQTFDGFEHWLEATALFVQRRK